MSGRVRLKRHAREALEGGRRLAQAVGCDLAYVGHNSDSHYRFAVTRDGQEIGRYTLSSSPKCPGDMVNISRQLLRRVIREAS